MVRTTMKSRSLSSALAIGLLIGMPGASAVSVPLPPSTKEYKGIYSQSINNIVEAADWNIDTFHSFMILPNRKQQEARPPLNSFSRILFRLRPARIFSTTPWAATFFQPLSPR